LHARLAEEFPGEPRYRLDRALTYCDQGNLLHGAAPNDSANCFQKGLALLETLADEGHHEPAFESALATAHSSLGELYRETNRPTEAERSLRKALQIREVLSRNPAENSDQQEAELARSHA